MSRFHNIDRLIDEQDEELHEMQMKARIRAIQSPEFYHVAYWTDQGKSPDELARDIRAWEAR